MDAPVIKNIDSKVSANANPIKPAACNAKPSPVKPMTNQEKTINQLRQEIMTLTKKVEEMIQKDDAQALLVTIPRDLFTKITLQLVDVVRISGKPMTLSEFINEALWFFIYCEEQERQWEEAQRLAKSDKRERG